MTLKNPYTIWLASCATLLFFCPGIYLFLLVFYNDYLIAHPEFQLWLSRGWITALLCFILVQWFKKIENPLKAAKDFLFEPASPYNLAMFRILHFSLYLIAIVFFQINAGKKMTAGFEHFPSENRVAIPWAEWYSLHFPVTPEIVDVLAPLFNISAIFMFLGLFTRYSSIIFLVTCYYLLSIHQMFGKIGCSHHLMWFPAILAFSDCGRVLSIDSLIRKYVLKREADLTPSVKYGFPIKTSLLLLGVIYFFPGFWKIWGAGFDWIFRYNLKYQLYVKWASLNYWTPFFRIDFHPYLLILSSIFVIAFEFGFVFLVLKPAYRLWLMLAGMAMHTGIYLLMQISFFSLWTAYPVLVDWEKIFNRLRKNRISLPDASQTSSTLWNEAVQIKGPVVIAAVLLLGNLVLGISKLKSYPFTCYPTFDYMVPHESDKIYYEAYKNGETIAGNEQVKQQIFRRRLPYNLLSVEDRLIHSWYSSDSARIEANILQIFPFKGDFRDYDSICLYKIKIPLEPELKDHVLDKKRVGVFYPNN